MKPAWLTTTPDSGSGNGTVANSAITHTGRTVRTGIVTVTGTGVSSPVTYNVSQSPLAEFVSFDSGASISTSKAGGTLTITGKTNSSKLTFSLGTGATLTLTLPTSYTANGANTVNGAAVANDPGVSSQFAFSIALTIPANTTTEELSATLIVTANGGQAKQIAITQAAGDAYLTITPTEITIPQDGTAQSITITSNTTWTVS